MKGMVHCFAFALPRLLERIAVTYYGWLSMVLLCLWGGGSRMSRFALLCSWERESVTRYGLLRFVLLWFVLFCSCKGRGVTCYDLLCIALLRFVLHCSALLCIALFICGIRKRQTKSML